jgi:hypothetical protein
VLRGQRTSGAVANEIFRVLRDPVLLVWSLFVLTIPFYIFTSGLPQPGDILILPLVPLAIAKWNGQLASRLARPLRILALFTLWVVVVDWGWALALGNFGVFGSDTFLLFPVYYVYNSLVFLVICVLVQRRGPRVMWLTLHVVFLSVVVQVLASFFLHRAQTFRGAGFFNNPNQLGFFALVSASIIALGKRNIGFGTLKASIGMTLCLYLALVSASRAAVIGIGLLFVVTLIANPKRILVAALAVIALVSVGGPVAEAIDGAQQRLGTDRYPQYTFFEERGYDRILKNEEYWVFGAGEGATQRFAETTRIGNAEIHSSIGTLFFCYGVIGLGLFLAFLYRVIRGASLRTMIILAPTLSYTLAHQGLRSTSVWILFGMFVGIKHIQTAAAPSAATAPAGPIVAPRGLPA